MGILLLFARRPRMRYVQYDTGWLFPVNNDKQLAEILSKAALLDKKVLKELGKETKSSVEKRRMPEPHYNKLIKLHEEVIDSNL